MLKPRLHFIQMVLAVAVVIFARPAFSGERTRTPLEDRLLSTYKDKPQMLLGFYCGKKLKFDADANLQGGGHPGPWTVCGDMHIEDIQIKQDEIIIKAHRIYLFYDPEKISFQDADLLVREKEKKGKNHLEERRLEIRIAQSKNADEGGIQATLDKLFRAAEQGFSDIAPDYWKPYLEGRKAAKNADVIHKKEQLAIVKPVTAADMSPGNAKPPLLIRSPDPEFSEQAREYKFHGTVVIRILIDTDGNPTETQITRPLGLGLDEKAVEAVRKWRFIPGKARDGNPVATWAVIEVNFRIY